ncbi:aminotransferase class I/II-fold pyridoxal phosphate-dependent enzyme [Salinicoccus carnicancri]|uniref:aminotransferase class I/II-fold pyridoxal phosphate-dependent enzyme n=1 Tax=Salinicoccus carnicancri TaxID=558170 RepID=UPI0002E26A97|nr:aminotransferase class I/II-fold pyridoxal phosphate-dependent enzyme [Salinicoccus carnicancri]
MANEMLRSIPPSYFGSAMAGEPARGELPLLNLAVGIPDGETPDVIKKAVADSVYLPENQRYGVFRGKRSFKDAIIRLYKKHYDVTLHEENIALLYGTKSGLVQFPMTFIEPGEGVYLPNPGYPDYMAGVKLARGEIYDLPLLAGNDFLPDFDSLDKDELSNARLIYLNYPSNPLGAVATKEFFDETVERFRGTRTRIVHDFAYAAFSFDEKHPSILSSDPSLECCMEIYSLSKGFNMSGFRVGFAVGNKEMVESINLYQDHTQTGMWGVLQDASVAALEHEEEILSMQHVKFQKRRDFFEKAVIESGIPLNPLKGGIFGWIAVPKGYDGESFADFLIREKSILVTPGRPFGSRGKNYIRISLAVDDAVLDAVIERLDTIKEMWR